MFTWAKTVKSLRIPSTSCQEDKIQTCRRDIKIN